MPNVIDATGKVVREVQTPAIFDEDFSEKSHVDLPRRLSRIRQPARRHRFDQEARRSRAAAAASRGSKRAPGARAKVRSVRRSGATAASSSDRSRAATSSDLNKKERTLAFVAALADRFKNGAVTVLDLAGLRDRPRRPISPSCSSAARRRPRRGPTTLIVCRQGRSSTPTRSHALRATCAGRRHRHAARSTSKTCCASSGSSSRPPRYDAVIGALAQGRQK